MTELRCNTCGLRVDPTEPGVLVVHPATGDRRVYCASHARTRPATVVRRPVRGWGFIHSLDRRWRRAIEQQRSADLLVHERQAIRSGDFSALHRELEPAMEAGKTLVVSWERSQPVVSDRETGETIHTPARPVLWITITAKVRKARGGWSVHFDVDDHRDRSEYMRRLPPTEGSDTATNEEAARASSYTSDTRSAIEPVQVVPHDDLERFAAEARVATVLRDGEAVEARLVRIGELPARERMAALHKLASDRGIDVRDDVKAFERRVIRRLGKAA